MNLVRRQKSSLEDARVLDPAGVPCKPENYPEILEHLSDVGFYLKDVNSR